MNPTNDLLSQLLGKWIEKGNPPDILSREIAPCGRVFIRYEWFDGTIRDYPYTDNRYDANRRQFQNFWRLMDGQI